MIFQSSCKDPPSKTGSLKKAIPGQFFACRIIQGHLSLILSSKAYFYASPTPGNLPTTGFPGKNHRTPKSPKSRKPSHRCLSLAPPSTNAKASDILQRSYVEVRRHWMVWGWVGKGRPRPPENFAKFHDICTVWSVKLNCIQLLRDCSWKGPTFTLKRCIVWFSHMAQLKGLRSPGPKHWRFGKID